MHQPITREQEVAYFAHFGWACLWSGELRSTSEIIGISVQTADGNEVGSVNDLVIDDLWTIRYLSLIAESTIPDLKMLVPPGLIERFDWAESKMYTSLADENIQSAPVYDSEQLIKREYEAQLFEHYGNTPYWE